MILRSLISRLKELSPNLSDNKVRASNDWIIIVDAEGDEIENIYLGEVDDN